MKLQIKIRTTKMDCVVIFGGSGFIGCFFADHLIKHNLTRKVYLLDIDHYQEKPFHFRRELIERHGDRIEFVTCDVRAPISFSPREKVSLIANFAAVHREPGHIEREYFETNIYGAENVTAWAEAQACQEIIFTSSISPYGVSESPKDELTLPVPVTAYGSSKLVAEKIHQAWQSRGVGSRKLTIVRPGVVFGPGEGGNVTRLVKAVSGGYFIYTGNRATRKAGIYVKELCNAIYWTHRRAAHPGTIVFNATMDPGPSVSEYVAATCSVAGIKRFVPSIPYGVLLSASYVIDMMAKMLRLDHPFSPVRIRKLVRSNNVVPLYLRRSGYVYLYDLESAFRDWRKESPSDWT